MRREFSTKVKAAAFQRAEGRCEHVDDHGRRCEAKLYPGTIAFDHIIADSIGGEPTLDNCAVLCRAHHAVKTATLDTPRAAKTKRQHDKNIGAVSRSSRPMPGSRLDRWRKKISGKVVPRHA